MKLNRISLSRAGRVRALCFAVAGVLTLGGFTAAGWKKAGKLERFLEYSYQQGFIELVTGVQTVDTTLRKSLYATGPAMTARLAGEVSREAAAAQAVMGRLPFADGIIENTAVFLARVSDYTSGLSRRAAAGQAAGREEMETLRALSETARALSAELGALQEIIHEQQMRVGAIALAGADAERRDGREGGWSAFRDGFRGMENCFEDLPALIYDGPFSAHLEQTAPRALEGLPEVGAESALHRALSLLDLQEGQLTLCRETNGKIPSYSFTGHLNGGEITVDITRRGGLPLAMVDTRTPGGAALGPEECVQRASEFLRRGGYESMTETCRYDSGGVLLVSFAFEGNGVVVYPDLIKVGVARDTGEIVQFEATGYIMNHLANRSEPSAAVSAEQARDVLAPGLTPERSRLCILPSPGGHDRLCHELTCLTPDGSRVLVYVCAGTGLEEKILILIEDENGTLAA
ncbi:MAG: germination protein YpeB [Oscillospiraceae bacterium]|nr:germination protein YpeB [Oscillospiraceae bacterium]